MSLIFGYEADFKNTSAGEQWRGREFKNLSSGEVPAHRKAVGGITEKRMKVAEQKSRAVKHSKATREIQIDGVTHAEMTHEAKRRGSRSMQCSN